MTRKQKKEPKKVKDITRKVGRPFWRDVANKL